MWGNGMAIQPVSRANGDPSLPADDPSSRLLAEAKVFIQSNAVAIVAAALAMLFAYGLLLTSQSLSEDEELGIYAEGVGPYLEQGRPVAMLIEVATTDTLPLPFFGPALALACLFASAIVFAFLFLRAAGQLAGHRVAVLLFLVVLTTLPVNAYFLTFSTLNVPVAVGFLLAGASAWFAWLWGAEGWDASNGIAAIMFGVLATLTYQGLTFVPLAAVLIAQLASIVGDGGRQSGRTRREIVTTLRLAAPPLAASAIGALISLLMMRDNDQHSALLRWGSEPAGAILGNLSAWISSYLVGDGFVGGWVLLPTVGAAVVLFVMLVRRAVRGAGWWPVVLLAGIVLTPFSLGLALGGEQLNRAMQGLPIVAASIWLLLALTVRGKHTVVAALLVSALVLTLWHGSVNSRLFLTELTTYEVDRAIATSIVERLAAAGWDGEQVPIVSVGRRAITPIEDHADDEAIGSSFYNSAGGLRTPAFLIATGHPFWFATSEQRERAHERALGMPSWPASGSVLIADGVAIVKFSDDYEFSLSGTW